MTEEIFHMALGLWGFGSLGGVRGVQRLAVSRNI